MLRTRAFAIYVFLCGSDREVIRRVSQIFSTIFVNLPMKGIHFHYLACKLIFTGQHKPP